jgi:hypothetical protein
MIVILHLLTQTETFRVATFRRRLQVPEREVPHEHDGPPPFLERKELR